VVFLAEDHLAEKVDYLARLGISQLTDQGICGKLHCLVHGEVFPFETPPQPAYQAQVKKLSALCRKFGIEHYVWLQMPNLAADVALLSEGSAGESQTPVGGGPNGMATTL